LNGEYIYKRELQFTDLFLNGADLFFEYIRIVHGEICFLDKHLALIYHNAELLDFTLPKNFTKKKLFRAIHRLIQQHKAFKGAVCQVTFFRKYGEDKSSYLITMSVEDNEFYSFNEKGLSLCVLDKYHNMPNYSRTVQKRSHLYSSAMIFAKKKGFDDSIILNIHSNICRCSDSNIFLIKDNTIITPSRDEGAIDDVMREVILEQCSEKKMIIADEAILQREHLHNADEVFLANSIKGIRWVGAFENKRYFRRKAQELHSLLSNRFITHIKDLRENVQDDKKSTFDDDNIFDFS